MDNYIRKDVHTPKLKFWGVTVVNNKFFKIIIITNELVPSLQKIRYLQKIKDNR